MCGVTSVSRHEASAGGGSFARQGGLIAQQNLAICVSREICTILPSGWFYLIKQIFCPT